MAFRSRPARISGALVLLALTACSRSPKTQQYPLEGQLFGVAPQRKELTISHKDIPNFMPAMTMGYFVRNVNELDGLAAGDLVTATLNVRGGEIWVDRIK